MASTYSDLKVELIGTGEQTGTWGTTTNNNLSIALGEAITGSADVVFSGSDVTLTLTDTNAAQTARNLRLNLTGTSGGARNLILGSGCQIEKLYLINNGLADPVTVKNTTGTGIAVPPGTTMFVFNNGTNVVEAVNTASSISTGAITCTSLTDTGLTSGRVTYATTGGLLTDSANMTFNGTTLTSGGYSTNGNLTFTGTGNRITGDFSNATVANRVLLQTSTTNGNTNLTLIPNGTGTNVSLFLDSDSATTNSSRLAMQILGASEARITSGAQGSGTALPLTMHTGGSERLRIDTSGNVSQSAGSYFLVNGGGFGWGDLSTYVGGSSATDIINFITNTSERMRIDSSGNVGIGLTNPSAVLHLNRSGSTETATKYTNGTATSGFVVGVSTAGEGLVYHIDNQPIRFATNNTERMRIDSAGRGWIGTTATYLGSSTLDQAGVQRPFNIYGSDSSTTIASSQASLTIANTDTTTNNTAQLTFAAVTGANTNFYASAAINCVFGARTNAQYPTGQLVFSTSSALNSAPTEKMRIDSSGNVGIGTSSPAAKLNVVGGNIRLDNNQGVEWGGGNNYIYGNETTDFIVLATNGSERMRIDSSGNVGIGTSSPAQRLDVVSTSGFTPIKFKSQYTQAGLLGTDNSAIWMGVGTDGLVTRYRVDATNDVLTMNTNSTERMRITSDGDLLVGTSSALSNAAKVQISGGSGSTITSETTGTGATDHVNFRNGNGKVGTITTNGSATSYNTSSDYRLKENIAPMTGALVKVAQLKPVTYKWKADGSNGQGFIAHELQEVAPYAVSGEKDGEQMQGVDYGKITPLLTAALQEAIAKIESLEARLAALESK